MIETSLTGYEMCCKCGFSYYGIRCECEAKEEITIIRKKFALQKAVSKMEKYLVGRNDYNKADMVTSNNSNTESGVE